MRKSLLAFILLSIVPASGQNLTSSQSYLEPLSVVGDRWSFPADLKAFVQLPEADGSRMYRGSPRTVLTVMQGEYAVLSAQDPDYRVLSSNGAGPCTMVLLATQDRVAIAHSHFDALTDARESLARMISDVRRFSRAPIMVTLAGGASDEQLLQRIVRELRYMSLRDVRFFRSSAIAIDREGEIFFNAVFSDNLITLDERRRALDEEITQIDLRIEEALRDPSCNTKLECIRGRVHRPLRRLYVSPAAPN